MNKAVCREYMISPAIDYELSPAVIDDLKRHLAGAAFSTCEKHLAFYTMKMIDALRMMPQSVLPEHYPGLTPDITPLAYMHNKMKLKGDSLPSNYSLSIACEILFVPFDDKTYCLLKAASEDFFVAFMQNPVFKPRPLSHTSYNSENIPLVGRTMVKDVVWGTDIVQVVADSLREKAVTVKIDFHYPAFIDYDFERICRYISRQSFIERVADVSIPLVQDRPITQIDMVNGILYVFDMLSAHSEDFRHSAAAATDRLVKVFTPDVLKMTCRELAGEWVDEEGSEGASGKDAGKILPFPNLHSAE